jgi:hypothetical protein
VAPPKPKPAARPCPSCQTPLRDGLCTGCRHRFDDAGVGTPAEDIFDRLTILEDALKKGTGGGPAPAPAPAPAPSKDPRVDKLLKFGKNVTGKDIDADNFDPDDPVLVQKGKGFAGMAQGFLGGMFGRRT